MESELFENLHLIVLGIMGLILIFSGVCLIALLGGLNNAHDDEWMHDDEWCDR